jgi:hypothetical protein
MNTLSVGLHKHSAAFLMLLVAALAAGTQNAATALHAPFFCLTGKFVD